MSKFLQSLRNYLVPTSQSRLNAVHRPRQSAFRRLESLEARLCLTNYPFVTPDPLMFPSIEEGDAPITLSLQFQTPMEYEELLHTVTISWGDGSPDIVIPDLPLDSIFGTPVGTFEHAYLDDGEYSISMVISVDNNGEIITADPRVIPVTVNNVAPQFEGPISITPVAQENGLVTVTGGYSDVGVLDTHQLIVDWGDNTTTTASVSNGTFSATHRYLDNGDYEATVRIVDNAGDFVQTGGGSETVTLDFESIPLTGGESYIFSSPFENFVVYEQDDFIVQIGNVTYEDPSDVSNPNVPLDSGIAWARDFGSYGSTALSSLSSDLRMIITQRNGLPFSLKSMEIAELYTNDYQYENPYLIFYGIHSDGSPNEGDFFIQKTTQPVGFAQFDIENTYGSLYQDLSTLFWTSQGGFQGAWTVDNIELIVGAAGLPNPTVHITNVAPTLTNQAPATAVPGQPLSIGGLFSDMGVNDGPFAYSVSFGDGSPAITGQAAIDALGSAGIATTGSFAANHVYTQRGTYTVTLTITDKDGAVTSNTSTLQVVAAGVQADPLNPGQNALFVGGSNSGDAIVVLNLGGGNLGVASTAGTFNFYAPVGRLVIYGQAGNDVIVLGSSVQTPAWIYGGSGNDTIIGGSGADVLFGDDGNDIIIGGAGRDIIVGGDGADLIVGNADDDIMIAGILDFSGVAGVNALSLDQQINAIRKEWTSSHTYHQRVENLSGHNDSNFHLRLNGNVFLDAATVFADGDRDFITGNAGSDWFFYNPTPDNDLATDLNNEAFANVLSWL